MTKEKKQQDRAQAAALDLFNTLARLGIWRCHLVMGDKLTGEFDELTVTGMQEAALASDLDDITVTLAKKPLVKEMMIEATPDGVTEGEEVVGDAEQL
jgi:hypothetical protein